MTSLKHFSLNVIYTLYQLECSSYLANFTYNSYWKMGGYKGMRSYFPIPPRLWNLLSNIRATPPAPLTVNRALSRVNHEV